MRDKAEKAWEGKERERIKAAKLIKAIPRKNNCSVPNSTANPACDQIELANIDFIFTFIAFVSVSVSLSKADRFPFPSSKGESNLFPILLCIWWQDIHNKTRKEQQLEM